MSNLRELTDREVDVVSGGWSLSNNNFFINIGSTVGAQIGQQFNGLLSLNGAGVQLGSLLGSKEISARTQCAETSWGALSTALRMG